MVVMNAVWGASYLVADIGLREMSPGALAAWRFLVTSALMFPLLALTKTPARLRRRDVPAVAVIGIVTVAGTYLLNYTGIAMDSATDRAVVSPLEPVALAVLAFLFLGERMDRRQWAGIVVACAGAYFLIARKALGGHGWHLREMAGQGLMLLSFFTEGLYSILGKPLLERIRPLALTTWAMTFAAVFLFAAMGLTGGLPPPPPSARAWAVVLFLAIPCTVIGYTLWYVLLEHLPAGVLGVFIFVLPVVGVALGIRFEGERLSPWLLLGAALIAAGVWLTGAPREHPELEPGA
jgi:drug/metabolite transporter (DMT)-like permease